jgi:predicted acetyltransferase
VGRGDDVWVRLLDLPAALAARSYTGAGEVVLDVLDPSGYAAGRVLLEADGAGSRCTPTQRAPELRLTQRALASCYLGGYSLAGLAIAGGVEELRPGALRRADALFSVPRRPWNPTGF